MGRCDSTGRFGAGVNDVRIFKLNTKRDNATIFWWHYLFESNYECQFKVMPRRSEQ